MTIFSNVFCTKTDLFAHKHEQTSNGHEIVSKRYAWQDGFQFPTMVIYQFNNGSGPKLIQTQTITFRFFL